MEVRAEEREAEQRLAALEKDRVQLEPFLRQQLLTHYADYIRFSEENGMATLRDPDSGDMRRDAVFSAFLTLRAQATRLIGPSDTDALFGTAEELQQTYDEAVCHERIDQALSTGVCRWTDRAFLSPEEGWKAI